MDFKSYYEYQSPRAEILGDLKRSDNIPECTCEECKRKFETLVHYSWDQCKRGAEWDKDRYVMCPPRVLGYALEQKRWVQLNIKNLVEPNKASPKVFEEKLQLDKDYKSIIRNTVQAHTQSKTKNISDYTPGKGKGLVILLWGKCDLNLM